MKVAVITFPGSNCDYDLYKAAQQVGGDATFMWHRERGLDGFDAVLLPGGFSYGDYLRAGAIARMSPIMEDVITFANAGGPVLGICNGFQILCESGLLPGALMHNNSLKFESKDVLLRVERADTLFTADYDAGQILRIPIAHGEGNYEADEETLAALEAEGRVVFRYVNAAGETSQQLKCQSPELRELAHDGTRLGPWKRWRAGEACEEECRYVPRRCADAPFVGGPR